MGPWAKLWRGVGGLTLPARGTNPNPPPTRHETRDLLRSLRPATRPRPAGPLGVPVRHQDGRGRDERGRHKRSALRAGSLRGGRLPRHPTQRRQGPRGRARCCPWGRSGSEARARSCFFRAKACKHFPPGGGVFPRLLPSGELWQAFACRAVSRCVGFSSPPAPSSRPSPGADPSRCFPVSSGSLRERSFFRAQACASFRRFRERGPPATGAHARAEPSSRPPSCSPSRRALRGE